MSVCISICQQDETTHQYAWAGQKGPGDTDNCT